MERFDVAENESSEIRFTESGGARYPRTRHSAFQTNVLVPRQSSIDVVRLLSELSQVRLPFKSWLTKHSCLEL